MQKLNKLIAMAALLGVLLIFSSGPAFANGYITVGSPFAASGGTMTVETGNIVTANLDANRSYACSAIPQALGSALDLSGTLLGKPAESNPSVKLIGDISPAVTGGDADNRLSIITDATGVYTFQVAAAQGGGETIRIECLETSLYGGYNTNVNDFNFLEIANITGSEINGTITAINYDGTVVINKEAFTITANKRQDFDIHSAAGDNKYGLIIINHDGPYGALVGAVSQYSGTPGSFDLSTSIPLKPRDNNL